MKLLSCKNVETSTHYTLLSFSATGGFFVGLFIVVRLFIFLISEIMKYDDMSHLRNELLDGKIIWICIFILIGLSMICTLFFLCIVPSYWNTHGEERIFIDDEKIVIKRFFHLTRNKDVIYFQDIIDVVPTTGVVGSLLGYAYNPDMITIISRSKARFHDRVTQCGINFTTEEQTAFIAMIKDLVDKKTNKNNI